MLPDYDCVIAGAGFAGAAQAIALNQLGLRVAVLDTRKPLTDEPNGASDVRGLALSASSKMVLEALEIWPSLRPALAPIEHIQVSDKGSFGAAHLHAREAGLDALAHVCPADVLARTLEARLEGAAELLWGAQLISLSPTADSIEALVQCGDQQRRLRAPLLIAADGVQSTVRSLCEIACDERDYGQSAIVANVAVEGADDTTAYERFTRDGTTALLPLGSGRFVSVRCCRDEQRDELMAYNEHQYASALAARFGGRFANIDLVGKRSYYPLRLRRAQQIIAQRVALIGAAAINVHPNGAQGLNLGLRDVAALGRSIKKAHDGNVDIGADETLADFRDARVDDHTRIVRFSDGLAQLFSSRLPLIGSLRAAAMLAFELSPAAKRRLIFRGTGLLTESL